MGASGWIYFVPWQKDLSKALADLRNDVFAKGLYLGGHGKSVKGREAHAPQPKTIPEALERCGEDGSHSILDVWEITTEPDYGAVAPLSPNDLEECFGTRLPSRGDVEESREAMLEIEERRGRGCGSYLVLYEGTKPSEICFFGYSGD